MKLIYVGQLVDEIVKEIRGGEGKYEVWLPHTFESKVSQILALLQSYKEQYQDKGIIPALNNHFEVNLFNTFRCYMDIEHRFPVKLTKHTDPRGAFVEVIV